MNSPFTDFLPVVPIGAIPELESFSEIKLKNPFSDEMLDEDSSSKSFQLYQTDEGLIYKNNINENYPDNENDNLVFEEEVNYEKAKRSNLIYAQQLRWNLFELEIYKLLGFDYTSPSDDEMVEAVANWQQANNLLPADGILGPSTWGAMLNTIIRQTSFPSANLKTAITANRQLKTILGWEKYELEVIKVLGFYEESPTEEMFAKAVFLWQPKLGFTGSMVDGRLGEKTWAAIRYYVLEEVNKTGTVTTNILEVPVKYSGIIKAQKGIFLHKKPSTGTKQITILYPYLQKVKAIVEFTNAGETDKWVKIETNDKNVGWIESKFLAIIDDDLLSSGLTKKPSPYLVQPGDKLDILVQRFYPDYAYELGNDRRTIIHAFSILNSGSKAIDYVGHSTTWWRNHVLDTDMAKTRAIYETIQLKQNYLIYFPNESYIKMLRDKRLVGVRPDWKNITLKIGKGITGFLLGLGEGFVDGAIGLLKDLWELLKGIVTLEFFKDIYDLVEEFSKYSISESLSKIWALIKEIVGEKIDSIKRDIDAAGADPFKKYRVIGKLVGALLFEIVITFVTAGASLVSKFAKIGKVAELLKTSSRLAKVTEKLRDPIKAAIKTWDKAEDLYDLVSIGSAAFSTVDTIKDISFEGRVITLVPGEEEFFLTDEIEYDQPLGLAERWGDEAENYIAEGLRNANKEMRSQGIPQMEHVLFGQYNNSGHGLDLFGFHIDDNTGRVFIYLIEVKGGIYTRIGRSKKGIQMGQKWLEYAIERALQNPALRARLVSTFQKVYPGKTFTDAAMKRRLLVARRVIVISKAALGENVTRLIRSLKRLRLKGIRIITKEVEDHENIFLPDPFQSYEDESFDEQENNEWKTEEESYKGNQAIQTNLISDAEIVGEAEYQATIAHYTPTNSQSCEGRTCWSKTVLNKLFGLNLSLNNTLDEASKKAIVDFQVKNNLRPTGIIDAATERALIEADAIQKQGTNAASVISVAKTRIEDWTSKGASGVKNKPQLILNSFRDPRQVWAFVLHHMAFKRRGPISKQFSDPESYLNTGAHFCIMFDGRIIQLHPISRMIWHGNCLSPRSVAVEFEGNFPNIKGQWWYPTDKKTGKKIKINEDSPTQAQYDAGRFLTSYLKIILGTTHILAHRQSSSSRENDPGPDIWYNVGQWSIDNLGMTDGGVSFKCGTGNPILPTWRTWDTKTTTNFNREYVETDGEVEWDKNLEANSYEFADNGFMNEIESIEDNYEQSEAEPSDFEQETEDLHGHEAVFFSGESPARDSPYS